MFLVFEDIIATISIIAIFIDSSSAEMVRL